jgi:hypothetical protein
MGFQTRGILCLNIALLFTCQPCFAQESSVEYYQSGLLRINNSFGYWFTPICSDQRFYSLEGEKDPTNSTGSRYVLNAYELDKPEAMATRELQFAQELEDDFYLCKFFMVEDNPVVLYRYWNKKSGRVRLIVESYDPLTLQTRTGPMEIGVIPLDPQSFSGHGPFVEVITSTSSDRILFYYDDVKLMDVQIVMCWVTDFQFAPEWSNVFKIPIPATSPMIESRFADDGSVYVSVYSVKLKDSNIKERANGKSTVNLSKQDLQNRKPLLFKLHGEELRLWEAEIEGSVIDDLRIDVLNGQLWFAALLASPEDNKQKDWLIGKMDNTFKPMVHTRFPIRSSKKRPDSISRFIMSDDERGYIIGSSWNQLYACHFGSSGECSYQTDMEWSEKQTPHPFTLNGELSIGLVTNAQKADEHSLLQFRSNSLKNYPVLVTFDKNGSPYVEQLISEKDGGARMFGVTPNFKSMETCGYFLDFSYDKKRPGMLVIRR